MADTNDLSDALRVKDAVFAKILTALASKPNGVANCMAFVVHVMAEMEAVLRCNLEANGMPNVDAEVEQLRRLARPDAEQWLAAASYFRTFHKSGREISGATGHG